MSPTKRDTVSSATAVIADDHGIVRAGLRAILTELRIEIVAEASNGFEAVASTKDHGPDLVVLDVIMPLAQGTEVVPEIRRWNPTTKIVVYTGVTKAATVAALIESGVDGLFFKGGGISELRDHLPLILEGGRYIAEEATALLNDSAPLAELTAREQQVMHMLIAGKSNREIADLLTISAKTVDKHRSNLMAKLDLHSFVELMQYALKHELVSDAMNEL